MESRTIFSLISVLFALMSAPNMAFARHSHGSHHHGHSHHKHGHHKTHSTPYVCPVPGYRAVVGFRTHDQAARYINRRGWVPHVIRDGSPPISKTDANAGRASSSGK